jgi:NAD(P)H-hydrate repair Nnr-like enzyme with NAD(P)H-hydrate dehydratase domain
MRENEPALWRSSLPQPQSEGHKYSRGVSRIVGAPEMTGATRLAATACARIGCGLVVVGCTPATYDIYRTTLPAHIVVKPDPAWQDSRITATLQGPGGMPGALLDVDHPQVLDAGALHANSMSLGSCTVITPHEGEFGRLFPNFQGDRNVRVLAAAREMGCFVVLKGHETLIAAPDGRCVINTNAPPTLATAGSGDVLSGLIAGLLAQGMEPFDAACAGVWIHGETARMAGAGLVASDLPDLIPEVLGEFYL